MVHSHYANSSFCLNGLQVAEWGADGVIVGSAMVKLLGEASSPEEGICALRNLTQDLRKALS